MRLHMWLWEMAFEACHKRWWQREACPNRITPLCPKIKTSSHPLPKKYVKKFTNNLTIGQGGHSHHGAHSCNWKGQVCEGGPTKAVGRGGDGEEADVRGHPISPIPHFHCSRFHSASRLELCSALLFESELHSALPSSRSPIPLSLPELLWMWNGLHMYTQGWLEVCIV